MESTNEIESQLREAISSSGQSLNQLGQAAGVNDAQLSRFMRGERTLTLETVGRLCQVLGLQFCRKDTPSTSTTSRPRKPDTSTEPAPKKDADLAKPPVKKTRKRKGE